MTQLNESSGSESAEESSQARYPPRAFVSAPDDILPAAGLEARIIQGDGEVVVKVIGEVDESTADFLWQAVQEAIHDNVRLILDLSETSFMSSAGINVLIRGRSQLMSKGGTVTLRSPHERVRTVLALTGLDTTFVIDNPNPH